MIYMGSKNKIAKHIIPLMIKSKSIPFVDAFCGGGNLIQHVNCDIRVANDINPYTTDFLKTIQTNTSWIPKNNQEFTEDDYKYVKNHQSEFPNYVLGHIGYNLSFGGKWFGGWCRNSVGKDYVKAGYDNAIKQAEKMKNTIILNKSYDEIDYPENSVIYCDIPYINTTSYDKIKFDHGKFYNWCRYMKSQGHTIFVSEYQMPCDFKCIWEKEVKMTLDVASNSRTATEKLFTL